MDERDFPLNDRDKQYDISLISELRKLPSEKEWAEFKFNNAEPAMTGEYLSAISNSAALHERDCGYVLYGIDNNDMYVEQTLALVEKAFQLI